MRLPRFGSARKESASKANRILAVGTLFLLLFLSIYGAVLWDGRNDAWRQYSHGADNLIVTINQDLARTFASYDLSLQGVVEALADPALAGLPASSRQMAMFDTAARAPYMSSILVLDENGDVRIESRSLEPRSTNYADRDYFQFQRDNPNAGLYVSRRFEGRLTKRPLLAISRRLTRPDGQFAGVVVGSIEARFFDDLFGKLVIGRHGSISLLRADGATIAKVSSAAQGRDFDRNIGLFKHFDQQSWGLFQGEAAYSGERRMYRYAQVGSLPLILNVGFANRDIYAVWRTKAALSGTLVAMLSIATMALLLLIRHRTLRLETQLTLFDTAIRNMPQGFSLFDKKRRLVSCNARYVEIYRLPPHLAKVGASVEDIGAHSRSAGGLSSAVVDQYTHDRAIMQSTSETSTRIYETDDDRTISVSRQPMPAGGWVGIHHDLTRQRRYEAQITHMAKHDSLTDLPNRVLFLEQLDKMLPRAINGCHLAILYIDLDGFKTVNDTLGHAVGDKLLTMVADRLRNSVRERDCVARLGGDEFAVIMQNGDDPVRYAGSLARRLLMSIGQPYDIDGARCVIGASIGVAVAPTDGATADALLKNADLALYQSKNEGRGRYHFYESEMDNRVRERRAMEIDLGRALAANEFELHYQPVIDLKTRSIERFEALLRWRHPVRGIIPPAAFIPLAEETGLITKIGEWVIKEACATARDWPSHIGVAVNLSPVQFRDETLVLKIVRALAKADLSPERLEFEVTESVMLRDTAAVLAMMTEMQALGARVSLDDFGTGYSSLSYLRRFPFDRLKIDRSFVSELAQSEDCQSIVRAILALASNLGMVATAEGVETIEQFRILQAEGCGEIQGYLLSKPMPQDEIDAFLQNYRLRADLAA